MQQTADQKRAALVEDFMKRARLNESQILLISFEFGGMSFVMASLLIGFTKVATLVGGLGFVGALCVATIVSRVAKALFVALSDDYWQIEDEVSEDET